jgi:hypothetical protein
MIDWKQDGSLMCGSETTETSIGKAIRLNEEAKPERDYLLDDKKKEVKEEMKTIFNNFVEGL